MSVVGYQLYAMGPDYPWSNVSGEWHHTFRYDKLMSKKALNRPKRWRLDSWGGSGAVANGLMFEIRLQNGDSGADLVLAVNVGAVPLGIPLPPRWNGKVKAVIAGAPTSDVPAAMWLNVIPMSREELELFDGCHDF